MSFTSKGGYLFFQRRKLKLSTINLSFLLQSALDGENVCIIGYGQTGSGKTYTMQGPEKATPDTQGIMPRAVVQLFEEAQLLTEKGWKVGT